MNPVLHKLGFGPRTGSWSSTPTTSECARRACRRSKGCNMLLLHPSVDTPELRALASDWQSRVANYEVCMRRELREHVRNAGIEVIGYRAFRDAMRG